MCVCVCVCVCVLFPSPLRSVQFEVISKHWGNPTCAPSHVLEGDSQRWCDCKMMVVSLDASSCKASPPADWCCLVYVLVRPLHQTTGVALIMSLAFCLQVMCQEQKQGCVLHCLLVFWIVCLCFGLFVCVSPQDEL